MFAWNCAEAGGQHLGTCVDRFYFGSCCKLPDVINSIEESTDKNEDAAPTTASTTTVSTTTTASTTTIKSSDDSTSGPNTILFPVDQGLNPSDLCTMDAIFSPEPFLDPCSFLFLSILLSSPNFQFTCNFM